LQSLRDNKKKERSLFLGRASRQSYGKLKDENYCGNSSALRILPVWRTQGRFNNSAAVKPKTG
jgi:hypothetical protein